MNNGEIEFEIIGETTSSTERLGFSTVPVLPIQTKNIPIDLTISPTASKVDKRISSELLRIDLDKVEEELDERVFPQYVDKATGLPVFNAHHKRVLIHGENGEKVEINNHEEMWKQQLKNAGKLELAREVLSGGAVTQSVKSEDDTMYSDDDFDFDDE